MERETFLMGLLKKDDLSDIEMHFEDYVFEGRKSDKKAVCYVRNSTL